MIYDPKPFPLLKFLASSTAVGVAAVLVRRLLKKKLGSVEVTVKQGELTRETVMSPPGEHERVEVPWGADV